jgi:hypothetical protein
MATNAEATSNMDRNRKQLLPQFQQLQDEHRRALAVGDIEAMERVQAELAELTKQDPRPARRLNG